MRIGYYIAVLALTWLPVSSYAAEFLSADEIKALFTNKTFDIHNITTDKHIQGYDNADGKHFVHVPSKGKTFTRKWWIEDGKHCTSHPKRGDSCKQMKDAGNGMYHGITDGTHTHTLSNFREGRHIK